MRRPEAPEVDDRAEGGIKGAPRKALLRLCRERDVGTMIIKAVAKGPWGNKLKIYDSWYEPFDEPKAIQQAVNFALSQDITGLCTLADPTILPILLDACENFSRAYLHHLDKCNEILGSQLNTIHNLHFYQQHMAAIREAIEAGRLELYSSEFYEQQGRGEAL